MANQNGAVDLDAYHDAVLDALKQEFAIFKTVEDYPQDRKPRATPALFVELEELEQANDQDPGTGQQALNLRMVARVIVPASDEKAGRQVRALAAAVASFVHLNKFGQAILAAQVVGAYQDAFSPELDQYLVWKVEWQQVGHFGCSVYDCSDPNAEAIFLAYSENGVNAPLDAFHQVLPPGGNETPK
ncbi:MULTISPECIES: hypothetical protein [unclassified Acidocella]|uniref:hypothetical protein n=1 Tax=unclassified Acidocella TaxID=2648610 RepID=UPI00028C47B4|nr:MULTISPECIES: hypothetical protein [unclassified Acidocella]EKN01119.1 hypothetical protein MXAZACID_02399 [Acidocella sp. MX-AZ02]WBO60548.1 hypothetical protein GT370_07195 [Acidocella sp. MX-AZ03]